MLCRVYAILQAILVMSWETSHTSHLGLFQKLTPYDGVILSDLHPHGG